jgi:hypothetical protein
MGQAAKAQLLQAAQEATGVRGSRWRDPFRLPHPSLTFSVAAPVPQMRSSPEDELALATIFLVGRGFLPFAMRLRIVP